MPALDVKYITKLKAMQESHCGILKDACLTLITGGKVQTLKHLETRSRMVGSPLREQFCFLFYPHNVYWKSGFCVSKAKDWYILAP